MAKMIIEGMRCFRSRQEVPLAPLTLLVGENSTGKSTFLAALRMAWDIQRGESEPNFNEDPFNLGAYDNIANYRGGRGGRAKSFLLGLETSDNGEKPIRVTATFIPEEGQPVVSKLEIQSQDCCITLSRGKDKRFMEFGLKLGEKIYALRTKEPFGDSFPFDLRFFFHFLTGREIVKEDGNEFQLSEVEGRQINKILMQVFRRGLPRPYAFAPIRTTPERTYNPEKETQRPAGGHIPMTLARLLSTSSENHSEFAKALSNFGHACGLFEDVKVRRKGRKASDPFQVEIQISGPAFNLVDMGYGVSQALPILVDSLGGERGQMFLMQQPEVHLHPRAQAALGTFMVNLIKRDNKTFVVETHSDYLIERIRMDIRDGVHKLKTEDVMILFFQRREAEVMIHPLRIDEHGNVLDAPKDYRRFFLEEERRFFGA
jgi:predicted ATPase